MAGVPVEPRTGDRVTDDLAARIQANTGITEPLCLGCTALAGRPVTQAHCEAGMRRAAGLDDPAPRPEDDE